MRRLPLTLFVLLACTVLTAQVRIDAAIEFSAADEALRQVTGLGQAVLPTEAVSVSSYRTGLFAIATSDGTEWAVSLNGIEGAPTPGTAITVLSPAPLTGPVLLRFNGLGPYALTMGPSSPLDGAATTEGAPLLIVFDGTGFQVMAPSHKGLRPCPPEMATVNDQYCMDLLPNTELMDFFQASAACGARGARLCSWSEFIAGCDQRIPLGITIVGQYEWVGSTCNEDGQARVSGLSSCFSTGCGNATGSTLRMHRCCLER
jgi:hypothetical protein